MNTREQELIKISLQYALCNLIDLQNNFCNADKNNKFGYVGRVELPTHDEIDELLKDFQDVL